jgi:hypothetical protein
MSDVPLPMKPNGSRGNFGVDTLKAIHEEVLE